MNSKNLGTWLAVVGLAVLPLAGGCVQEASSASGDTNNPAGSNVPSAPLAISSNAASPALLAPAIGAGTNEQGAALAEDMPDMPAVDIADADFKPVQAEKPLPATVRTNGPVSEILRMSESGVDTGVLLAFVTNSTASFNLSADEVIYLNDIGVASEVVSAMLQRDQVLRGGTVTTIAQAAPSASQQTAPAAAAGPTSDWGTPPQGGQAQTAPPQSAESIAPQQAAPQQQAQVPTAQGTPPPPPQEGVAQPQTAPAPQQQVNYNNFYSTLSPYGSWVYIEGYGQVWQPTVVVANPTWEPYVQGGRWMYTDAGWYWASDYSWGWAPFHYGRWFRHYRLGWCWYPQYTWSPAWVAWRWTDGYCGWAALPPSAWYSPGIGLTYWGSHVSASFNFGLGYNQFSFVSWGHFRSHHYHEYRVDSYHARGIYESSRPYHRYDGDRYHVRNYGPSADRVARYSGSEVRRVSLRETVEISRGARADRLASDGRTLNVYRPKLEQAHFAGQPNRTSPFGSRDSSGVTTGNRAPGSSFAERPTISGIGGSRAGEKGVATQSLPNRTVAGSGSPARLETPNPTKTWERPAPAVSTMSSAQRERVTQLASANTASTQPIRRSDSSPGIASRQVNRDSSITPPSRQVPGIAGGNSRTPGVSLANRAAPSLPQQSAPNTPAANRMESPQRATAVAPQQPNASASTPAPSRIYMGNRESAPAPRTTPQAPRTTETPAAPAPRYNLGGGQPRTPSAAPTRDWPAPQQQQLNRQQIPAYTPPSTPSAPSYSAPQRSMPSYTAPQRSTPAPAPSYTPQPRAFNNREVPSSSYSQPMPQRSAPAPAYSAPAQSYSAPSRSYSAPPAQSAPSRSYSEPPAQSAPQRSFGSSSPGNFSNSRTERSTAFGGRDR